MLKLSRYQCTYSPLPFFALYGILSRISWVMPPPAGFDSNTHITLEKVTRGYAGRWKCEYMF